MFNGNKAKVKTGADEFAYALKLTSRIDDEIQKERIQNAWFWYIRKSRWAKNWFYFLSILGIMSGTGVLVVNCIPLENVSKAILTSVTAIIGSTATAVCTLYTFKETWRRNRSFAEIIKIECYDYLSVTGEYLGKSQETAKTLFDSNIDAIISEEGKQWNDSKKLLEFKLTHRND